MGPCDASGPINSLLTHHLSPILALPHPGADPTVSTKALSQMLQSGDDEFKALFALAESGDQVAMEELSDKLNAELYPSACPPSPLACILPACLPACASACLPPHLRPIRPITNPHAVFDTSVFKEIAATNPLGKLTSNKEVRGSSDCLPASVSV